MDHVQPFERWDEPDMSIPEPVDDPCFAGLFDQFRTIAADCRVVLSGEGADNLMHFEMWPYVKDMMRNREWRNLIAKTLRYVRVRLLTWPGLKRRTRGLFRKDLPAPVYPQWLAPDFARRLNLKDRVRNGAALPGLAPSSCASQGARLAIVTALGSYVRA